jgi:hypothetical protein
MFEDILTDHNPHWIGELRENILPRSVLPLVLDWMKTPMIVSLVGVRRCGKSTLLYAVINHLILKEHVTPENILYLNLEEMRFTAYRNDPLYLETLLEDYRKLKNPSGLIYCFFDEIQYFEQWPIFVKSHFERKKNEIFSYGLQFHAPLFRPPYPSFRKNPIPRNLPTSLQGIHPSTRHFL